MTEVNRATNISNSNDDVYEVEKIVDTRMDDDGSKYIYRVRWKGCPPEDDTWEPRDNLLTCDDLLKAFKRERKELRAKAKLKKKDKEKEKNSNKNHLKPNLQTISVKTEPVSEDNLATTDVHKIKAKKTSGGLKASSVASPRSNVVSPSSDLDDVAGMTRKQRLLMERAIEQSIKDAQKTYAEQIDNPGELKHKANVKKKKPSENNSDDEILYRKKKHKKLPIVDDSPETDSSSLPDNTLVNMADDLGSEDIMKNKTHKPSDIINDLFEKPKQKEVLYSAKDNVIKQDSPENELKGTPTGKEKGYVSLMDQLQRKMENSHIITPDPLPSPLAEVLCSINATDWSTTKENDFSKPNSFSSEDSEELDESTKMLLSKWGDKRYQNLKDVSKMKEQEKYSPNSKKKKNIPDTAELTDRISVADNENVSVGGSKVTKAVQNLQQLVTQKRYFVDTAAELDSASASKSVHPHNTDINLQRKTSSNMEVHKKGSSNTECLKSIEGPAIKTFTNSALNAVLSKINISQPNSGEGLKRQVINHTMSVKPSTSTNNSDEKNILNINKKINTEKSKFINDVDFQKQDISDIRTNNSTNSNANTLNKTSASTNSNLKTSNKTSTCTSSIVIASKTSTGTNSNVKTSNKTSTSTNSNIKTSNKSRNTPVKSSSNILAKNEKELHKKQSTVTAAATKPTLFKSVSTPVQALPSAETSVTKVLHKSRSHLDQTDLVSSPKKSRIDDSAKDSSSLSKKITKPIPDKSKKLSLQEYKAKKRSSRSVSVPDNPGLFLEFTKVPRVESASTSVSINSVDKVTITAPRSSVERQNSLEKSKDKFPTGSQLATNTDVLGNILEVIESSVENSTDTNQETSKQKGTNTLNRSEEEGPGSTVQDDEDITLEEDMDIDSESQEESDIDGELADYSGDEDGLLMFSEPGTVKPPHTNLPYANTIVLDNINVYQAIKSGDDETLIRCYISETNINTYVHGEDTLLTKAVMECAPKMVKILLEKGADPNVASKNGESPLMAAVELNQRGLVVMLIQNGARLNTQTGNGETALVMACKHGHMEIIHVLLNSGADVKADPQYLKKMIANAPQHLRPIVRTTLQKHLESLKKITETVLSDVMKSNKMHLWKPLMNCRCISPDEMDEHDFYFECDISASERFINVLLLALPVTFERSGRINVDFSVDDNGVEDVLLNNEKMIANLPGNHCLYILFPNIGEVNILKIKSSRSRSCKVLLCVYAMRYMNQVVQQTPNRVAQRQLSVH